ncbi:hypothetical protein [Campylobacter ureolyticus]|nr:hypothetical protein [Campylobacter ureolyticus]MCZ6156597.1 hypothetical protein [Campylobacter ureolyticus]
MKKIAVIMGILMIFLTGCADKPKKIEKISPCAFSSLIKVG